MKKTIISLTALAMFVSAATHAEADTSKKTDFLLIGGGIMSASLGTWLQALQPDWDLTMVEKLTAWRWSLPTAGIMPVLATRRIWS